MAMRGMIIVDGGGPAMHTPEHNSSLRFGPYVTPVVAIGVIVECEARGLVTVVGLSKAPIPWPIGDRHGQHELIVFKALARAVRQESPEAVAAAWGVSLATAQQWKKVCRQPRPRKKQTLASPAIPWKPSEDELVGNLSLAEAARLTGRTLTAVRKRRRMLGLPDGRLATQRAARTHSLEQQAQAACSVLRSRTKVLSDSLSELRMTFARSKATLAFWHTMQGRSLPAVSQNTTWSG